MGGESPDNDSRLTIGKQYFVRNTLYSPSSDVERVSVWVCSDDDDDKDKLCRIDLNNFGTLNELRDRKIKQII